MKKWKLVSFYKDKIIDKHRMAVEPFPGVNLLRWVVFIPATHAVKYEGKPSCQALEIIKKYCLKTRKRLMLLEFDRGGPIVALTFYGENFEVQDVHWDLWIKYHGNVPVSEVIQAYRRNRNDRVSKNAEIG